ncbi:hypothetical protein QOZ80_9AG0688000 [Eleusine coracana subsp. coracana]|nr:hypothetical protein QOZ80_9AG0688000 [Eleusine coracana subsp. coracana]
MSSSISLVMHLLPFTVLGLLSCSAATDTLIPGRALTQNDKLVSANGKFALGFFPSGSKFTNNTYLGIWFNQVPELTPVWTAHRDSPISNQSTRELKISTNGNLIILAESTVIWSTKANITTNGTVAILLNNGNFVLRNSSNSSQTFWESFDYPTDIALSGAKLGWNKITGVDRRLVSRKNSVDQASGLYSSGMDSDGIGQQVWNSSVVYWSSGTWNGKFFSSEPEMAAGSSVVTYTYFKSDQEAYFIYTIMDDRIIMYNVLDVSGQRMMRTWTGKNWNSLNTVPKSKCEIYATCGPFTICADNGDTLCKCMKGFSIKSPEDWELEDTSGGCIRNTPLNCGGGKRNKTGIADKFYSMPGTRLPPNRKAKEVQSSKSKKSIGKIIGSVVAASIASIVKRLDGTRQGDKEFRAEVNFGMAKFLGREFSRVVTTMRGTIGYLAPEWISGTAVTSKVDVYSYGMVLLEIISGRRNWNVKISCDDDHAGSFPMQVAHNDDHKGDFSVYRTHNDDDYAGSFPVQVAYKLLHGDISGLADPRLNGNVNLAEVERFCKVACWCIQDNEFDRPTMNEVVQCLEGTSDPDMPPMPKLLHAIAGISHVHYNHDS